MGRVEDGAPGDAHNVRDRSKGHVRPPERQTVPTHGDTHDVRIFAKCLVEDLQQYP